MQTKVNAPMIVVSNRLPFTLERNTEGQLRRIQCAGGLVTAVAPVVIECKGLWVGWPGIQLASADEKIPESDPNDQSPTARLLSEQVEAILIDTDLFDAYYNGCCNATFWPLFHSMPDRAIFKQDTYAAYKAVNEHFAEKTLDALRKSLAKLEEEGRTDVAPLVWIHDYQLMLAANTIRQVAEDEGLRCKMSFFLHIPFPAWDIMRLFPWDDEILEGILGCDLVGFHIDDYCLNFLDCCQRRLGCRVDRTRFLLELDGRTIHVKSLPIGIPYEHFADMSRKSPKVLSENHQQIILGVDRLDYTKGLVNRVKAFERLLEKRPEYLEKVTFLQVAVPSRTDVKEYQALKEEMDQVIGRINGRFSKPNWSPIRYIFGCISQEQLAAFYRDSAVAIVTPLRDGMNLVAKEYVACQDLKDPGVLLLSPFAGAGGIMHEAVIVNPYELDDVADKIHRALQMPFEERYLRMKNLQKRERERDVSYWLKTFLSALGLLVCDLNNNSNYLTKMNPLSVDDFDHYLSDFIDFSKPIASENTKLNLILDYDGTLAPISQKPNLAHLPLETRESLEELAKRPQNVSICIISGRGMEDLKQRVQLDGITYAACHGLEIHYADGTEYNHPISSEHLSKLLDLSVDLKVICDEEGGAGAWIEKRGALLTLHYREVPMGLKAALVKKVSAIFAIHGFAVHQAPMALEAKPKVQWDKGRASIHILNKTNGDEWSDNVRVIYAGDDPSDEEAMESLSGIACTFKVSSTCKPSARTSANYRLRSPEEVQLMLQWIERRLNSKDRTNSNSSHPNSPKIRGSPPPFGSFSYDESSDDEMRRIRCNSRGKTQNIIRRQCSKSSLLNSAVRSLSESPEPLPGSSENILYNRVL